MRYFGQQDRYSCAAIGLLNAFKWMGIATSAKHLPGLKMMLGTKPVVGTYQRRFRQVMWDAGFARIYKPTIEKIDAELIAGNALIVDTRKENQRLGHVYLIVRRTKHHFVCVNVFRGETVSLVSKTRIKRQYLRKPMVFRVKPLEVGPNLIYYAPKAA